MTAMDAAGDVTPQIEAKEGQRFKRLHQLKFLTFVIGILSLLCAFCWEKFAEQTVVDEHGFTANHLPSEIFNVYWSEAAESLKRELLHAVRKNNLGFRSCSNDGKNDQVKQTRESAVSPKEAIYEAVGVPFCVSTPSPYYLRKEDHYRPIYSRTSNATSFEMHKFDAVSGEEWIAWTVPSQRGDNRDLFGHVLTVPMDSISDESSGTAAAIASFVMAARFLAGMPGNSRDIFFLVVDNKKPFVSAVRDFLSTSDATSSGTPLASGAIIRGAVVYDLDSEALNFFDGDPFADKQSLAAYIVTEGPNGMLPNQDAVNIFVRQAKSAGLPIGISAGWKQVAAMARVDCSLNAPHYPLLQRNIPAFLLRLNKKSCCSNDEGSPLIK